MLVLQRPIFFLSISQIPTFSIKCNHLASHIVRPIVVAVGVGNHGETREVIPRAEHGP